MRYHYILNYTIPYYNILYYTILYYTILYYTILYYTIVYAGGVGDSKNSVRGYFLDIPRFEESQAAKSDKTDTCLP